MKNSVAATALMLVSSADLVAQDPLRIYFDADRTRATAAGDAIERGIRVAFDEVGYRLGNRKVEIVAVDHRGNTLRSRRNVRKAAEDANGLLVFAGMHSPPLLKNRTLIHQLRLPVLVPWAAAGPITRHPSPENWIFRLSIDDSKAGHVIAHHAVRVRGAKAPLLLLEETGWGRSNERTMTTAIKKLGMPAPAVRWFRWGIDRTTARKMLDSARRDGADVALLVANAPEARIFVETNARLPKEQRLRILSHWGLTGDDFAKKVAFADRQACGLEFIQTRFSFLSTPPSSFGAKVFARTKRLFPDLKKPADLRAPTGFVHAYDLTRLLIAACRDTDLTGSIRDVRTRVRNRMEELDVNVVGLLKTYHRPFSRFAKGNPDAHEALRTEDFTMGRYRKDGAIELLTAKPSARPQK